MIKMEEKEIRMIIAIIENILGIFIQSSKQKEIIREIKKLK